MNLFEPLEPRTLLYSWTPQEVYFAELVNRARANPVAEAARLAVDFTSGLTFGEQQLLVPSEPLALDASLTQAARLHSADMAAHNFFDHTNPSGFNATRRAQDAGYPGTAGENIGAGYPSIDALYQFWMSLPNERRNILSLYTTFDSNFHYDDLGLGIALNVPGALYSSYYTADFGNPTPTARSPHLLGVVYTDANADNFYNIGEGLASVRIDAFAGPSASGTPVATYTTDAAGNYQFPLASGSYTILFTRLSDNFQIAKPITISGQNAKLDAKASELTPPPPPPPPPDDYANAGQWSLAAPITVNPTTGSGSISGVIGIPGDSDLFTFVAAKSGPTTISGLPTGAAFTARIRVYNAAQSLIASGAPGSQAANSIAQVSLTAGSTYYILIDAGTTAATGNYTVQIDGPPNQPPPTLPPQYLADTSLPANTTYSMGKPVLAFVSQAGHPTVAIRSALGVWSSTDLQAATGSPAVSGDVLTWVDSRDNLLYACATSALGLLVFKRDTSGAWSCRNLTSEIRVSRPITSNLTTFTDASGLRQIAGLDAGGRLVSYWMTGLLWPQGWRYYFTDLAARDLTLRNHPMPAVSGNITSYTTQKNVLNILATDSAGGVYLFYRAGGGLATQLWNWANLSALTGAPAIVGGVSASETSGRITTISGVDAGGNLWMLTWRSGEGWRARNASAAATGASGTALPGSLTSWINAAGASFTAAVTSAGEVVLFRYAFTAGQHTWTYASISGAVPNAPLPAGPLRAATLASGAILITAVTSTGEAVRFTFTPSQTWAAESVSRLLAP